MRELLIAMLDSHLPKTEQYILFGVAMIVAGYLEQAGFWRKKK